MSGREESNIPGPSSDNRMELDISTENRNNLRINPAIIAKSLKDEYLQSEEKKRRTQERHMIVRSALAATIPPQTSGLAKSVLEWVKAMLGILDPRSKLPPIPTKEELLLVKNLVPDIRKAAESFIEQKLESAKQSSASGSLNTVEESFVRRKAMKHLSSSVATSSYKLSLTQEIGSKAHSDMWILHGHGIIKQAGFPRCTYNWEEHAKSSWNYSMTAALLAGWELCHKHGGTKFYNIDENHNTPAGCIGVINRWFSGKKTQYKKENSISSSFTQQSALFGFLPVQGSSRQPEIIAQLERTTEAISLSEKEKSALRSKHKNQKKSLRKEAAVRLITDKHPNVSIIFIHDNIMSDNEADEQGRPKKSFAWRSKHLVELLHTLDEGYVQLGVPERNKKIRRAKVEDLRSPRLYPGDISMGYGEIPPKIPKNWVFEDALKKLSEVELMALELEEDLDLTPALLDLKRKVNKPTIL